MSSHEQATFYAIYSRRVQVSAAIQHWLPRQRQDKSAHVDERIARSMPPALPFIYAIWRATREHAKAMDVVSGEDEEREERARVYEVPVFRARLASSRLIRLPAQRALPARCSRCAHMVVLDAVAVERKFTRALSFSSSSLLFLLSSPLRLMSG